MPQEVSAPASFPRVDRVLRSPWVPWALAAIAAVVAVWVNHAIYPGFTWNRDEPVYLWQADILRAGQLTTEAGARPELVHPWLGGLHDGRFFSQYPLGWPAVLAVAGALGIPELALVAAAVLAVVGTYALAHELLDDRRIAALSGGLLLVSPIFAIQSGAFLTYLFALGIGTLFATFLLRSVRVGSGWRAAVAGALLGWMVMTRNYDAVVWAVVVGGYVVGSGWRRWRELARLVPWFLAGIVPLVGFQLWHNAHLTGSPLEFPITVADPLDTFGFGYRRLMPKLAPFDYRPIDALRGTAKNAFFTPWFLFGAYLGAALAAVGIGAHAKDRRTWFLVALGVGFPLAYFPFWGVHVSSLTTRISGPIYSIPAYVPLCILMARGLVWGAQRHRRVTAAAVVAMVVITIPVAIGRLGLNRQLSRLQLGWTASVEPIEGPAFVVVADSGYLMQLNPHADDPPGPPGDIAYLVDGEPSILDELDAHPERAAYYQQVDVPSNEIAPAENTRSYEVELVPIEVVRGEALAVTATMAMPGDGVAHVTLADEDGEVLATGTATGAAGEDVEVTFDLVEGADADAVGEDRVAVPSGGAVLEATVGFGSSPEDAEAAPVVRARLLVHSGAEMRTLLPVTILRPDPAVDPEDNDGVIVWRDDLPSSDLSISVEGRSDS